LSGWSDNGVETGAKVEKLGEFYILVEAGSTNFDWRRSELAGDECCYLCWAVEGECNCHRSVSASQVTSSSSYSSTSFLFFWDVWFWFWFFFFKFLAVWLVRRKSGRVRRQRGMLTEIQLWGMSIILRSHTLMVSRMYLHTHIVINLGGKICLCMILRSVYEFGVCAISSAKKDFRCLRRKW